MKEMWASDTPISQPVPPDKRVLVDFDGFGFTMGGPCHNLTEGESEEIFVPTIAPEGFRDWMDLDNRV